MKKAEEDDLYEEKVVEKFDISEISAKLSENRTKRTDFIQLMEQKKMTASELIHPLKSEFINVINL